MVWDPKDPWSKKSDSLDDAFRQAQSQLRDLLPSGGLKNIILVAAAIFLIWQSAFIVAPDEEGVVENVSAFPFAPCCLALTSKFRSWKACCSPKWPSFTGLRWDSEKTGKDADR